LISSFDHFPKFANEYYVDCSNNNIVTFDGCPKLYYLNVRKNPLKSFSSLPATVQNIEFTYNNDLKLLALIPLMMKGLIIDPYDWPAAIDKFFDIDTLDEMYKEHKNIKSFILYIQKELIDNGFVGNAGW
jgi:hypothetical protein